MKKTLHVFILLVALYSICVSQTTKTDREEAGLIGTVKTVQSKSVDYDGDKVKGEGFMKQDGDLITYDLQGNEIDRKPVSEFGEGISKMSKVFNSNGLMTESVWRDTKGNIVSKDTFIYSSGRLLEYQTYDGKGTLIERVVKSYDSSGRVATETYYDPATPVAKTVFKYDANGNVSETTFFMADGTKATAPVGPCLGAHRVTSAYDDKGQIISQTFFEDSGTLKRKLTYSYDTKGRVIANTVETQGSITKFLLKYGFDAKGNWISRVSTGTSLEKGLTVFGHKPTPYIRTKVTTREINYY